MNKWFHDKNGDVSSKRLAGFIILGCGLILMMILGIMSLSTIAKDADTVMQVSNTLMITGGSLLGIGVIEHVSSKGETK